MGRKVRKPNPEIESRNAEIQQKFAAGQKAASLAVEYNLHISGIYAIVKKKRQVEEPRPAAAHKPDLPPSTVNNEDIKNLNDIHHEQKLREQSSLSQELEKMIEILKEVISRQCKVVDLYESEGFYDNRLLSINRNFKFFRKGEGTVMMIQVPNMKKAREAAVKGFIRFFPQSLED